MKSCYYCGKEAEKYVGMIGAIVSVSIILGIIPVEILRAKLKKRHRELTELTDIDSIRGGGSGRDASSSMMRYLQDNQRHSQQDLTSLSSSVPFSQNNNPYNQSQSHQQQQQHPHFQQQQQQYNPSNLNQYNQQHISPEQYQQMGHVSQQNYLMQQHLLQQHRNQQQQQQQQNFNYQPTHPAYYQ